MRFLISLLVILAIACLARAGQPQAPLPPQAPAVRVVEVAEPRVSVPACDCASTARKPQKVEVASAFTERFDCTLPATFSAAHFTQVAPVVQSAPAASYYQPPQTYYAPTYYQPMYSQPIYSAPAYYQPARSFGGSCSGGG